MLMVIEFNYSFGIKIKNTQPIDYKEVNYCL